MCKMASFLYKVTENGLDLKVGVLDSHSETEKIVNDKTFREGHYFPDGTIECRRIPEDRWSKNDAEEMVRARWPSFARFFSWAIKSDGYVGCENFDLRGLTSAKDLVLPKTVGGWLYLSGLTSAKDLVLPKTVGGGLYLSGLTSEERRSVMKTMNGGSK